MTETAAAIGLNVLMGSISPSACSAALVRSRLIPPGERQTAPTFAQAAT